MAGRAGVELEREQRKTVARHDEPVWLVRSVSRLVCPQASHIGV